MHIIGEEDHLQDRYFFKTDRRRRRQRRESKIRNRRFYGACFIHKLTVSYSQAVTNADEVVKTSDVSPVKISSLHSFQR